MTRTEALDRVNELKGHLDNDDALFDYKDEIDALSLAVLGHKVKRCNCRNRYTDALITIYKKLKNNEPMKSEITTRMRRGFLITWKGKHYTCHNITDEVAREYLAEFPQNAKMFEVLPPAVEEPQEAAIPAENAADAQENTETINNTPKRKKSRKTAKNA
jgi:hypothetical protein